MSRLAKAALISTAAILCAAWTPMVDEFADFNMTAKQLETLVTHSQIQLTDQKGGYACICGPSVSYAEIPKVLVDALVATEDRRYFETKGFDFLATVGAIADTLQGKEMRGASGIAQQTCKNLVLSAEQTGSRKMNEIVCAKKLSDVFSKEKVLEIYFNGVNYGTNSDGAPIYGLLNASLTFFGKHPNQLTLLEAAGLVGLLKAPSTYSPLRKRKNFLKRASVALGQMNKYGYITAEQMQAAINSKLKRGKATPIVFEHRYFTQWVLKSLYAKGAELNVGDRIPITFQPTTQSQTQVGFAQGMKRLGLSPAHSAAYGVIANDGRVLAMMGGRDFSTVSQFNVFTDGRRQPGSAFKAIVYGAAMEEGLTLRDRLYDGKRGRDDFKASLLPANPKLMTVKEAFAQSANIPAIRALRIAGTENVILKSSQSGIKTKMQPSDGLALGSYEVSPVDLTGAYTPFANAGTYREPFGFFGVSSKVGVYKYWYRPKSEEVYSEKTVSSMRVLLSAVVKDGTGKAANSIKGAMGKTGTTDDNKDAWFVGLTSKTITTVWIGKYDGAGVSGKEAAGVWADVVGGYVR
jgi:penicillin-binding protein 1A